jgi:hypothetical protein
VSLPAAVGCAYKTSPTCQSSSPTEIAVSSVPRVSNPLTYPKYVTNPFTPLFMSSVAIPKNLTSRTFPSAVNGAAVILPEPTVTPDA